MAADPPFLAMHGICKRFGATLANDDVAINLERGDILGLLGENGAGKTTLMNILFGAYAPDAGRIEIDGTPVEMTNSAVALRHGVGMVHQHFHLVARHSVLENLMTGRPGRHGLLDRSGALARLDEISAHYGLDLEPDRLAGGLSIGEQQRLEILKALFWGARILILDEPTAVLTPQEARRLFKALKAMAEKGMAIIFISHKLVEVLDLTSHIAILRNGLKVADLATADVNNKAELAELMCGHALTPPHRAKQQKAGPVLMALDGITAGGRGRQLHDINLTLRGGEIVGIAGVSGNGQQELADVIAGVEPVLSGHIEIDGHPITDPDPVKMQAAGIGRVPEDRMGTGLITGLPLADNFVLSRAGQAPFSRFGFLSRTKIEQFARRQIELFSITAAGLNIRTGTLSGGNLQKVLLARELAWKPKVLLAAQPTRGLDVSAVDFVHEQLLAVRSAGGAVLLICEDLEELLQLCDRIAVLYEGRIAGVVDRKNASRNEIGLLMGGAAS